MRSCSRWSRPVVGLVENQHPRVGARARLATAQALALPPLLSRNGVALALVLEADRFEPLRSHRRRISSSGKPKLRGGPRIARLRPARWRRKSDGPDSGKTYCDFARRLRWTHLRAVLAVNRHAPRGGLQQSDDVSSPEVVLPEPFLSRRSPENSPASTLRSIESRNARPVRVAVAHVFDSDKCGTGISNLSQAQASWRTRDFAMLSKNSADDPLDTAPRNRVVSLLDAFSVARSIPEHLKRAAKSGRAHARIAVSSSVRANTSEWWTVGGDFSSLAPERLCDLLLGSSSDSCSITIRLKP